MVFESNSELAIKARAAAKAYGPPEPIANTELNSKTIVLESMNIAGGIDIYTNREIVIEELNA